MHVTTGKNTENLSFSMLISPGSLPIKGRCWLNINTRPKSAINTPTISNVFPIVAIAEIDYKVTVSDMQK